MKNMIKEIKKHGSFTEEDLEIAKSLLNKSANPQFYEPNDGTSYTLPPGIEYVDTTIIDEKALTREGTIGSSQPIRAAGGNLKRGDLARDIAENGWKLYCMPIAVIIKNGKIVFLDGRTKDNILLGHKYLNRIVNLYKFVGEHEHDIALQDDAIEDFGLEGNEEKFIAGHNVQEDFVQIALRKIERGTLKLEKNEILSWVNSRAKSFSKQKREDMASRIYHHTAGTNAGLNVISWTSEEAQVWLKSNNYINNNKVIYLVQSAEMTSKAFFAACALVVENPDKEIRLVIHTGTLTGWDRPKRYVEKILKFRKDFLLKLSQTSYGFFGGHRFNFDNIKLYGALPANIANLCEDEGKLIVFNKNDQMIEEYIQNNSPNTIYDYLGDELTVG
jgi:hypothetical protein